MSFGTSSELPLSGSLLVTETSVKPFAPERASVTATLEAMSTSLWLGGQRLFGVALTVQAGAVLSSLIVTLWEAVPPALVAVQVKVLPAVSAVMFVEPHSMSVVTVDSGSVTVQLAVTSLVYQPLLPRVPVMVGVMTGGVVSAVMVRL